MRKVEMNEMIMVDAGKFCFGNGKFGILGGLINFGVTVENDGDHIFICKIGEIGFEYSYEPFTYIESENVFLTPGGIVKTVIALVGSIFS